MQNDVEVGERHEMITTGKWMQRFKNLRKYFKCHLFPNYYIPFSDISFG